MRGVRLGQVFGTIVVIAAVLIGCRTEPRADPSTTTLTDETETMAQGPLLGLRSGIYHVADLQAAKHWYAELLGQQPYFDEPFYVGFDVGGYELGLNPDTSKVQPGAGGTMLYWGVADADAALVRLGELGAKVIEPVTDVGGGIRHAIVTDPFGNLFGVIENPHFQAGG
jgi:predicted enzyme related to lactoylglutathione lyase